MFSPSSTSPLLAIPDDNFFRMAPHDMKQGIAITRMLESHGKEAVVVIQRGDTWGDGIYVAFEPEYTSGGGVILERIRYSSDVTDFSSYLQTAENAMSTAVNTYGWDACAVQIISFDEFVPMINQTENYPTLWNMTWFGSDGTALSWTVMNESPRAAMHLKIFSTLAATPHSDKYYDLYDRYYALTGIPYGFYTATTYDISWALTKAVLETQSTQATDIIPILPLICYDMYGATGWCRLDENDDRFMSDYEIWGYGDHEYGPDSYVYGVYYSNIDEVIWDIDRLGYNPNP